MTPPVAIPFRGAPEGSKVLPEKSTTAGSFYHLSGRSLTDHTCQGTACFVARHLGPFLPPDPGQLATRVYCVGQCFLPPGKAADRNAQPPIEVRSRQGVVLERLAKHGRVSTLDTYKQLGGYQALPVAFKSKPEQLIQEMGKSGLRGRGGAGFPTGKKWRAVFDQTDSQKYLVANADEGDPGAYIDRFLMENDPFALVEGMTIAAFAIGATKGWIYLRAEYPDAEGRLSDALEEARQAGLLGDQILGQNFSFDIEIFIGHGSYICGEETAMLNSIEGRRPEVRVRPPYPTVEGLWKRPTLVNNVETLVSVPWIIKHSGEAYHEMGFSASRGTKVVSLNSLFNRPGLYEIEFGVSVRHIVEELGGGLRDGAKLHGVIIGGPLAGIIPPHLLDTLFGFEELQRIGASVGHGGVIAFDECTSIVELIHHVFAFGSYESCGKCTPCRLGSSRIEQMFANVLPDEIADGHNLRDYEGIVAALELTSLCGLGTGLAAFAESAQRFYGTELRSCLR